MNKLRKFVFEMFGGTWLPGYWRPRLDKNGEIYMFVKDEEFFK